MNVAVILSGGAGARAGANIPKQYVMAGGTTMIGRTLRAFFLHPQIDAVQIVADEQWRDLIRQEIGAIAVDKGDRSLPDKLRGFSASGEVRALSIVNALHDLREFAKDDDVVVIHDAARPFVSADLIGRLIAALKTHDGALPVLPMKDTVYLAKETDRSKTPVVRTIDALLPRERVVAGQAPEAFKYGKYLAASDALLPEKILAINGSTEPAILSGMDVAIIDGEERNVKITSAEDMQKFLKNHGDPA